MMLGFGLFRPLGLKSEVTCFGIPRRWHKVHIAPRGVNGIMRGSAYRSGYIPGILRRGVGRSLLSCRTGKGLS